MLCGVVSLSQLCVRVRARLRCLDDTKMEFQNDFSLKEWAKDKPLSILQLDPADRAVLRIAGKSIRALFDI